jgi:aspartyl-tRNA(Asn)/glutamyl-tRNA(Gln) amidotransferase subunit C
MTTLTLDDVTHVAKLASLPLTEDEIKKFQKQLSVVISYIDELSEVDTSDTEPTSQTTGLENVFRNDEIDVLRQLNSDDALSGSDKTYNGYFVADMVLKEKQE